MRAGLWSRGVRTAARCSGVEGDAERLPSRPVLRICVAFQEDSLKAFPRSTQLSPGIRSDLRAVSALPEIRLITAGLPGALSHLFPLINL